MSEQNVRNVCRATVAELTVMIGLVKQAEARLNAAADATSPETLEGRLLKLLASGMEDEANYLRARRETAPETRDDN